MSAFKNKYFLSQMTNVPTHKACNILDLLFTNNHPLINEMRAMLSNFADHYVVEIATPLCKRPPAEQDIHQYAGFIKLLQW